MRWEVRYLLGGVDLSDLSPDEYTVKGGWRLQLSGHVDKFLPNRVTLAPECHVVLSELSSKPWSTGFHVWMKLQLRT